MIYLIRIIYLSFPFKILYCTLEDLHPYMGILWKLFRMPYINEMPPVLIKNFNEERRDIKSFFFWSNWHCLLEIMKLTNIDSFSDYWFYRPELPLQIKLLNTLNGDRPYILAHNPFSPVIVSATHPVARVWSSKSCDHRLGLK